MAKGITEPQVHAAADALVIAGERPTVERIRAHLGTGSPNTVTRMLDGWWQTLGERLTAQQAKLALPDAPAEVVTLAGQLWEQAFQQAQTQVTAAVAQERESLMAAQAAIEAERNVHQKERETWQAAIGIAQQAQAQVEIRLSDAQHLIEQQTAQLTDLTLQRASLQDRNERLEQELMALAARLQQQEHAAASEREAQSQHLRAIEDRSHAEIDRARQDTKDARNRLAALERELAVERQRLQHEQQEMRDATTAAQREAAAQRARAEALDAHLTQLGSLSTALQATLAQGASVLRARQPRKAPASGKVSKRAK